ncbi:MAG: sigma-70 family RNA polymerase sigma factor [Rhodobacteraceae bacterium]|jgi:RNA polymerase sigma-70 factor (ECF subfamily)|nr:sigma-70 family RNA polymerase sigma factor [Paracoccaceae bacterium]
MSVLEDIEAAIPALRRYALALVRDRSRADDLVQDCLERAVAKRHLWRGDGPVRAWLFTILVNRHRDLLRSQPLPSHLIAVDDLLQEPAAPARLDGHMELRDVHAAMGRLPLDQREALLMVAIGGKSFAEACTILDIPKGTLMSRLARARATLRALTGRTAPSLPQTNPGNARA